MIKSVKLLEFGIFQKNPGRSFREQNDNSPVGYYLRTDCLDLVEQTTQIDARLGVVFGIKYLIENKEKDTPVHYICRITHPPLTNPSNGNTFDKITENKEDATPRRVNTDFYEFEYEWELQEGEWNFEIVEGEKILLSKKFRVTKISSGNN